MNYDLVEEFARAVCSAAIEQGVSPNQLLLAVSAGRYVELSEGRLLISTTEGGGSSTFHVPEEIKPGMLAGVISQARRYLAQHPGMVADPTNYIPRRMSRLRASFARASV